MPFTIANSGVISSGTTIVSGETLQIVSGDVFTDTHIVGGGELNVNGFAITSDTMVSNGGVDFVNDGGTAYNPHILFGGYDDDDGIEYGALVAGYGYQLVYDGTSFDTLVETGGVQAVLASANTSGHFIAQAEESSLEAGGLQVLSAYGTAVGTDVSSGGEIAVLGNGRLELGYVQSGGLLFIEGGVASGTTLASGATGLLLPQGAAQGLMVEAGATLISTGVVVAGANTQFISGVDLTDSYFIYNFGSVTTEATQFDYGGHAYVLNGGTAIGATVGAAELDDSAVTVERGGTLVSAQVAGSFEVMSGGFVTHATLYRGGIEILDNSGEAGVAGGRDQYSVLSFGTQRDQGYALSDVVMSGAVQSVTSNGVASGTTVYQGGSLVASAYGQVIGAVISGGVLDVLDAQTQGDVLIGDGAALVLSGVAAADNDTTVSSGGLLAVGANNNSEQSVIVGSGLKIVYSAGLSLRDHISAGGLEAVEPDGVASATVVSNGGTLLVQGYAVSTTLLSGATLIVQSGGSLSQEFFGSGYVDEVTSRGETGTTLGSGAVQRVGAGGTTAAVIVRAFGTQDVDGGVTTATTVSSGGLQTLSSGTTSATAVMSGGLQQVAGGLASGTHISSGGTLAVGGGTASGAFVTSGAMEVVDGGTDADATVRGVLLGYDYFPGSQVVSAGIVMNATVASGGEQDVNGGTVHGAMVTFEGDQIVRSGGTVSGTVVVGSGSGNTPFAPAFQTVFDGEVDDTMVAYGGEQHVDSGVVSHTMLGSGAIETVFGGIVEDVAVDAGATQEADGGVVSGVMVSGAAAEQLVDGAVVSATTVTGGGEQFVSLGSTVSTRLASGGIAIVYPGGSAMATEIGAGGTLTASGAVISATVVDSGGTEFLASGGQGSLTTLHMGGTIDLGALDFVSAGTAAFDPRSNTLTVTQGTRSYTEQLAGNYAGGTFQMTADGLHGTDVSVDGLACYVGGTLIRTVAGDVPIERLRIGDQVVTHGGTARGIGWIGFRHYDGRFIARNPDALPVLFRAGALADGVPARDLRVSPLHAMFLDGVLIPARLLVNGASIVQEEAVDDVAYFHIELATHDVIIAEGAASESFVDCDSRFMFQNAAAFAALYPDGLGTPWQFCAARVESGLCLEAVRRRLARRAGLAPRPGVRPSFHLDVANAEKIAGWALEDGLPPTRVLLDLMLDGALVARIAANEFRRDLARAGKGDGRCGFSHVFDPPLLPATAQVLSLREVGGSELARVTIYSEPDLPGPLDGCIDVCDGVTVHGWAVDAAWPDRPVLLDVLCDGASIGQVRANDFRPDLRAAGKGPCAFTFPIAAHVTGCETIAIRRTSDRAVLANAPVQWPRKQAR